MSETADEAGQREQQHRAERDQPGRSEKADRPADTTRTDSGRSRDEAIDDDKKPNRRWPLIILGIVVVAAIIGGVVYWLLTRNEETTDDAYTDGNAIAYAAKVSGYVTQLNINDNTYVHTGDLLLKIDPRDYTTARDQARANLSLARAQLSSAEVDLAIARRSRSGDLGTGAGATSAGAGESGSG